MMRKPIRPPIDGAKEQAKLVMAKNSRPPSRTARRP